MKLEVNKNYRITKNGKSKDFTPETIDRENDEVYLKITTPMVYHQGFKLSELESKEGIEEIV